MKSTDPRSNPTKNTAAADLIRGKLAELYAEESGTTTKKPAKKEPTAPKEPTAKQSKHQQFMHELNRSGRSLADIQTAWHTYYTSLPDKEKHQVWQEFYAQHDHTKATPASRAAASALRPVEPQKSADNPPTTRPIPRTKTHTVRRVKTRRKLTKREHLTSLLFGLGAGFLTVVILMFSFFNERFIAPFITPSKTVSNNSIIVDPSDTAAGPEPEIIIPKINVELPVIYTQDSIDEAAMQSSLEDGVVHYAITPDPGEKGNGAIFGHSSNNILNKGKYKFAFVLLHRLEVGDTFILQKDGKRYVYKVFNKKVVPPTDVSVLNDTYGKSATFSLITCDPPGTSTNRLVVTGEQISPDPVKNKPSSAKTISAGQQPSELPSNSPSLWSRITGWLF